MNDVTNANSKKNINDTAIFINNIYDNLSYYDLYGTSVFLFFIITIIVILAFLFTKVMISKDEIASDWENQRCKPSNIPFAGYISKPEGKTEFEYTSENFQYCIQDVLLKISENSLKPFNFMIDSIATIFQKISESINKIREILASIRQNMKNITQNIMNRTLNILIPLQTMIVSLLDTFNKTQGILTAGLYTALGSYYTLQALLGAIMELIIKMLIALVILIVGLWVVPFTQPMAATMSAVFLAISIPLAIIAIFMKKVLHVSSAKIPKLRCFDKNTQFKLSNNSYESIQNLKLGDKLFDESIITTKIKISSTNLDIYNLNDVIVSESHVVKFHDKWIQVKEHPDAKLLLNYNEPFLYCINTSKKLFELNGITYTDWDEVYDDDLKYILSLNLNFRQFGFEENTKIKMKNGVNKNISNIKIGDLLYSSDDEINNEVYGIVELIDLKKNKKLFNLLITGKYFIANDCLKEDYNSKISHLLKLYKTKIESSNINNQL